MVTQDTHPVSGPSGPSGPISPPPARLSTSHPSSRRPSYPTSTSPLQHADGHLATTATTTGHGSSSSSSINGPLPLRHPRPLTAGELFCELEKEQEAVVNRLTRELSHLRAQQSASVASTASSSASAGIEVSDHGHGYGHGHGMLDLSHSPLFMSEPGGVALAGGRHRRSSSSSVSHRGRGGGGVMAGPGATAATAASTSASASASASHGTTPSQASIERARDGILPISRQNSMTARRSRPSSPGPSLSTPAHVESLPPHYQHRQSLTSGPHPHPHAHPHPHPHAVLPASSPPTLAALTSSSSGSGSHTTCPTTARYEETALHRAELELALGENEVLKARIRELERLLRSRTPSRGPASDRVARQQRTSSASASAPVSLAATAVAPVAPVATDSARIARPRKGEGEGESESESESGGIAAAAAAPAAAPQTTTSSADERGRSDQRT
ncbi:MAG: hypothetical protein M1826_004590 [Phylliscum demangeonii]|nr:MAG: hypothetical protein M1826_004590 [Phylliscum demangeonii]